MSLTDENDHWSTRRLTWTDGLCAVLGALWYAALLFSGERYAGVDGFYHLAEARSIVAEGLFAGVNSLPYTVLGDGGPDHHFLFHLVAVPFAFIDGLLGIRLAALFFAVLANAGIVFWLRRSGCRVPWLHWLLLIATCEVYNFRMVLLRTQTVDIPLVLFAVYLVVRRRPRLAALLGIVFSWTHHGALILIPVAAICAVVCSCLRRRAEWRSALWLLLGFTAGQIINPWFPHNVEYLMFHALFKPANALGLPMGAEWLPAQPAFVAGHLWPANLAVLIVAGGLIWRRVKPSCDTAAFAAIWLMFIWLTLKHGRFIGFLVPVSVALCALGVRDLGWLHRPHRWRSFVVVLLASGLVVLSVFRFVGTRAILDNEVGESDYVGAGEWLNQNAAPNEVIFNLHWDDYPILTYHCPGLRFVIGLDPSYLAYANPKAFRLWIEMARGQKPVDQLVARIPVELHAQYIVAHPSDRTRLAASRELRPVHRSPKLEIWQIIN